MHSPTEPRVLALIPGYNEERAIGEVVTAASAHLPVLVIDDGSKDATAARALARRSTLLDDSMSLEQDGSKRHQEPFSLPIELATTFSLIFCEYAFPKRRMDI